MRKRPCKHIARIRTNCMKKVGVTASFGYKQPFETRIIEIDDKLVNHTNLSEILDDMLKAEIIEYHIL
jgi:hypothetical protein